MVYWVKHFAVCKDFKISRERIAAINHRAKEKNITIPQYALWLSKGAYKLAEKCGWRDEMAWSLLMMSYANRSLSNYITCTRHLLVALPIFVDAGNKEGELKALNLLGTNYFYFSKYEQALDCFNKGFEIAKDIGNQELEAAILNNIGEIYRQLDKFQEALEYYREALVLSELLKATRNIAGILLNIGHVYNSFNQGDKALDYYNRSLKYSRKLGDKINQGEALNKIGEVYEQLAQDKIALEYYWDGLRLFEECGNKFYRIDVLVSAGRLLIKQNQPKGADYLRDALNLAEEISAEGKCASIHLLLSEYYEIKNDAKLALEHYKKHSVVEKKIRNETLEGRLKLMSIEFSITQITREKEIYRLKNMELEKKNEEIENKAKLLVVANKKLRKLHNQLKEANLRLERLSTIDDLTGIPNRRCFDNTLKREWNRCLRERKSLSIILVDIDNFKLYNDRYGHLQGDLCLREVANALSAELKRSSDFVGRFGGEEFAAILVNADYDSVITVAERMRRTIEELKILHECASNAHYITISLGTATITPTPRSNYLELVNAADHKLYDAKNFGRNQVKSIRL